MKLATLSDGTKDGKLIVLSSDGSRFLSGETAAPDLQTALENWEVADPQLRSLAARLQKGEGEALHNRILAAPLPRAWQWLDGSAFDSHGRLMARLFGIQAKQSNLPLMYQGMSHRFLGPQDDVPLPHEAHGIDFEGEFAVITDDVPMGVTSQAAAAHIKLVVMVNDWSLRALAGPEMKTGFGWIQAKPACSMAPFAVTPDELGAGWAHERVQMRLRVEVNDVWFGEPHGGEMGVSFADLIAHAAATRSLCAGTVIGSGTIANEDHATVGSTCIAERRAVEILSNGAAATEYLRFGDRVRMAAVCPNGLSPFGVIDQRVVGNQSG
ncbi:MAG TPA: fumarylacetoacetate hydrolase family protein [Bryobacteraceae bacterium]|nr:fumarylacetoacetate hydrolase family protein [Bryobacteraceae bacterium]